MWVLHTAFLATFLFSFSFGSELKQRSEVCPVINTGHSKVVCYYEGRRQVKDVYVCGCTHIVYTGNLNVQNLEDVAKDLLKKQPNMKFILRITGKEKDLTKLMKSSHYHGVELYNVHNELDRMRVLKNVKEIKHGIGSGSILMVSLPSVSELLAKYYDMKALQKYVDVFVLETHNLGDVHHVTFHPSRLSGLWDMMNMDSSVDLVVGLGVPAHKVVVLSPATAYLFILTNKVLNTPSSPTMGRPGSMNQEELCNMIKVGNWTLERDQDLSAPYTFQDKKWIAFEDPSSLDVKSKYTRVRGLGGHGLISIDDDYNTECEGRLLDHIVKSLSTQVRAPRRAVLGSLKNEILSIPQNQFWSDSVQLSPYRITRLVDADGIVHPIREDTRTEFECQRQGYFVHPRTCNRFYRCVKFDQQSDEFTVFEFDCPSGLEFDSRYEVCVWPGSLDAGQACPGSSEIAPVPQTRFICPAQEGYYADPENCRWFFACLDHGKQVLTAYEFRCPFGLGFDEKRLLCDWPWLIPACGDVGKYESTLYDHGHNRNAVILNGPSAFVGNTADSINVAGYESLLSGAKYNNFIGIQSVQGTRTQGIEGSPVQANGEYYQVDTNDKQPYNDYNTFVNPEIRAQHSKQNVYNVYPGLYLNESHGVNGMTFDKMSYDDIYKYAVQGANTFNGITQNTQNYNQVPSQGYQLNGYILGEHAANVNSEQNIHTPTYQGEYKLNTVASNSNDKGVNYDEYKLKTSLPEQYNSGAYNSGEFVDAVKYTGNNDAYAINRAPNVYVSTEAADIKYNTDANIQVNTENSNIQQQQFVINPYHDRDSVKGGNIHFGFINPPAHNFNIERYQYEPIKQNRSLEYSELLGEQLAAGAINSGLIGQTRRVNVGELQHIQDMSHQAIQTYLSSYKTNTLQGTSQPAVTQATYPEGLSIHGDTFNSQPSYPTQETILDYSQPVVQQQVSTPTSEYLSQHSTIRPPLSTYTYDQSGPSNLNNKLPFNYHQVETQYLNHKPYIYSTQQHSNTPTITYQSTITAEKPKTPTIVYTGNEYQHSYNQFKDTLPSAGPTSTIVQHTSSTQYNPTSSNINLDSTTQATPFYSERYVLPNIPQVKYSTPKPILVTSKPDLNVEINADHISKTVINPVTAIPYPSNYDYSTKYNVESDGLYTTLAKLKFGLEDIKIPENTHDLHSTQPNVEKNFLNPTIPSISYETYSTKPTEVVDSTYNNNPGFVNTNQNTPENSFNVYTSQPGSEEIRTKYDLNKPSILNTGFDIRSKFTNEQNNYYKLNQQTKAINEFNINQQSGGNTGYSFNVHSTQAGIGVNNYKPSRLGVIQYAIRYPNRPQAGYYAYKPGNINTNVNTYTSLMGGNNNLHNTANINSGIEVYPTGENYKSGKSVSLNNGLATYQTTGGNTKNSFDVSWTTGGINTVNTNNQGSNINAGYDLSFAPPTSGTKQSYSFGGSSIRTSNDNYNANGFVSNGYHSAGGTNSFLINGGNYLHLPVGDDNIKNLSFEENSKSKSSATVNYTPNKADQTNIDISNIKLLVNQGEENANTQGSHTISSSTSQSQKLYGKISFNGHVEITRNGKNKPIIAIVTKLNDYNPLIVSKLGAQCSCCNDRKVKLRSRTSLTENQQVSSEEYDDEEKIIEYNEDDIPYYNGNEELTKIDDSSIITKPKIIVSSTLSPIIVEDVDVDENNQSAKNIQTIVVEERSRKNKKSQKHIKLEKEDETESSDSTKGIECKREGLFRHPKNCNKFYSCGWDSFKKKYVLHEFRCPIQLSFDHKMGACNWPSQGPACQSNTLLPSRY